MWSSFMPFIPSFSHFLKNLHLYGVNHTLSMADCQSHIPTERFSASSTSSLTFLNAPRSVFAQPRQPLSARLYSYPASCARALNSIIFSNRRLCSSSIKYDHALLPGRIQSAFSYILSLMGAAAWAITRQCASSSSERHTVTMRHGVFPPFIKNLSVSHSSVLNLPAPSERRAMPG